METRHTFNQSIHYSLKLRECPEYVELYRKISEIIKDSPLNYKVKPTGLYSELELKEANDKKYRLYNLTAENIIFYDYNNPCQYIMLGFTSKYNLRAFLKDFHIDKKDVALCFYNEAIIKDENRKRVGKDGVYKIIFKISPTTYFSLESFAKSLTYYTNSYAKSTYGKVRIYRKIHLASGIHDRWFDPFTFEKITDFNKIYNNFIIATERGIKLENILQICKAKMTHYVENQSKSVSTYISNSQKVDSKKLEIEAFSTSFYNKYLSEKNPYKISKFKKDWKFAAELFIQEILGKYRYQLNRPKNQDDIDTYKYSKQLIKDCYDFDKDNLDAEIAHEISKLEQEIRDAELDIEFYELQLDKLERSWKPREIKPEKTDEELINFYHNNSFADLFKMTWKTPEAYVKYIRSQEENKRIDELYGFTKTNEYQECLKKIKDLKTDIKFTQSSINFYKDYKYRQKYDKVHKEYNDIFTKLYGLVFSKREISLFLNNLKLQTKICSHKFRKIILDVLSEHNMLVSDGVYNRFTYTCKRYIVNRDAWNKMKSILKLQKASNSIIYLQSKYNIKLENHLLENSKKNTNFNINNIEITKKIAPRSEYFGPPD